MRAALTLLALVPMAAPQIVSAQTDEIQVYDGSLAAKGKFNLTLHNNFTPEGLATPAFADISDYVSMHRRLALGSRAQADAAYDKLMQEAKQRFPQDLDYAVALDTTLAVTEGLNEIKHTLFEAIILVILVVYIFLQGWRATLIPLLAVPVFYSLFDDVAQTAVFQRIGAGGRWVFSIFKKRKRSDDDIPLEGDEVTH